MLGLKRGELQLADSHEEWNLYFEQMRELLSGALGQRALTIEHIGSTSIPGILAKPIVDVCIGITSYEAGFDYVPIMEKIGFEYFGQYGLEGRHYYMNEGILKKCHVHMLRFDSIDYIEHILFRDYLRENPDEAQLYSSFKKSLVEKKIQRWEYVQLKDPLIKEIIARAKK